MSSIDNYLDRGSSIDVEQRKKLYRPLRTEIDEMRFLLLEPGLGEDPLTCRLIYWNSQFSDLQYETVSYCWGEEYTTLEVQGIELAVPQSAKQTLYRLRLRKAPRFLWLDSICLDQSSNSEKSYQVARMHHIYRGGIRNLIWLGPDDGTTKRAVQIVQSLLIDIRQSTDHFRTFRQVVLDLRAGIFSRTPTIDFDPLPLINLFSRPWFSRLWVKQEVALSASNIMFCGDYEFSPLDLHRVAQWLLYKAHFWEYDSRGGNAIWIAANMTSHADHEFDWYRDYSAWSTSTRSWEELLCAQQQHNARDPKDRVYALLGMHSHFSREETLEPLLCPDYSRPLLDIYRDATRYALGDLASVNILAWVRRHCSEEHEGYGHTWPSWVPCWHHHRDEAIEEHWLASFFKANANAPTHANPTPVEDVNRLLVFGFYVDLFKGSRIQRTTWTFTGMMWEFEHFFEIAAALLKLNVCDSSILDTDSSLIETLLAGKNADNLPVTAKDIDEYQAFRDFGFPRMASDSPRLDSPDKAEQSAARFGIALIEAMKRRKVFVTEAGRLGLGPQCMQVGDVVVVFCGSRWPFVLRPRPDVAGFELVGTAYVHGVMYGEAVRDESEMEEFVLV